MYNIINFIKLEGCLLNNKVITYPFRVIKVGDVLTINKKYFNKILNDIQPYVKLPCLSKSYVHVIRIILIILDICIMQKNS